MIASKQNHTHKFTKPIKARVMLRDKDGVITGEDVVKLHKCTCKKARAYDLERKAR